MFLPIVLSSSSSYLDSQVLTDLGTVLSQIPTWIGNNKYLVIAFTLGMIGIGISLFWKMRRILR